MKFTCNIDLTNPDVQTLAQTLNTTANDERTAGYMALAVYFARTTTSIREKNTTVTMDDKFGISDFVYSINELSIVDRELLTKLIIDTLNYQNNLFAPAKMLVHNVSFNDVLGVTNFFGLDTITAVDKNIEIFNKVQNLLNRFSLITIEG